MRTAIQWNELYRKICFADPAVHGQLLPNPSNINFIQLVIDESYSQGLSDGEKKGQCPCKIADKPCHSRCSCVHGGSSSGCIVCASYGSEEQRRQTANRIVLSLRNAAGVYTQGRANGMKEAVDIPFTFAQRRTNELESEFVYRNLNMFRKAILSAIERK